MYTDNFQGYEMRPCDTQNIHFNVNVMNDKLQDVNDFPFHLIPSAYRCTITQTPCPQIPGLGNDTC